MDLGCIRKRAEHEHGNKPVSSSPPRSLLQFLPPTSYLEFMTWLPLMVPDIPFLSSSGFRSVFYRNRNDARTLSLVLVGKHITFMLCEKQKSYAWCGKEPLSTFFFIGYMVTWFQHSFRHRRLILDIIVFFTFFVCHGSICKHLCGLVCL